MSDLMGFTRKKGDLWTVQEVQRIANYMSKYQWLITSQKYTDLAAQVVIIKDLRNEYPDYTEAVRSDGALKERIEYLYEVMIGKKDINEIPSYDKGFYNKLTH